jgi:AmiR/NasT family two-component response regulator
VAEAGRELAESCRKPRPNPVIADVKRARRGRDRRGRAARPLRADLVILVSAHHDADSIRRVGANHGLSHRVGPIKQADLEWAQGLLTKKAGIEETEAFRRLQNLVGESNRQLAEGARILLTAGGRFGSPRRGVAGRVVIESWTGETPSSSSFRPRRNP